jgi:hypothetical protein
MRSFSFTSGNSSRRHARESGHLVNAGASVIFTGGSGILDRPLSRTMTPSFVVRLSLVSPQHLRDLFGGERRRDPAVGDHRHGIF